MGSSDGTTVYGSVRTVVWEGWAGDRSPYPDPPMIMLTPNNELGQRRKLRLLSPIGCGAGGALII